MSFASLGLSPALVRAIDERGYRVPTPIQSQALPPALRGGDVLGCAQTGSGKTAAFVLPILQQIQNSRRDRPRRLQALILVPTRELAAQVGESVRALGKYLSEPLKVGVFFGGVSINPQMMGLRGGADIVVATPGRLLDLVEHNALSLSGVSTLVLDEADRLLDMGFADELSRILSLLPTHRQHLFFSATFPPAVQGLAEQLLHEPTRIEIAAEPATAPDIQQRAIAVDVGQRTRLLSHLIKTHDWSRVLVFAATKYGTELLAHKLCRAGIDAAPFHGELSQGLRTQVLAAFKESSVKVLVATDVAARGIDIARMPVVVNYDLPRSADDYVHRIGRTGRAGEQGLAVSFITAATEAHFRLIEKRQEMRVPREQIAGFEPVETEAPVADSTGGIKGHRKSKKDKLREAAARGE